MRQHHTLLTCIRASGFAFVTCVLVSASSAISTAQSVSPLATADKLKQPIHMSAEHITLETIAAQLSQQTGLHIEAVPYLREHRTTVQFDGGSAEALLTALVELNGWQWQEDRDGKIVISRALGRRPQSLAEVPAAIQRAMAKDVRHYLYVDKKSAIPELKKEVWHNYTPDADGNIQISEGPPRKRKVVQPPSPFEEAYNRGAAREKNIAENAKFRMDAVIASSVNLLSDSLKSTAPEYKPVEFAQLTDWQRSLLMARHILPALEMLTYTETYDVTYDCLKPYFLDIGNLEVVFKGSSTIDFIWTIMENGQPTSIGFGQQTDPDWLPR